MLDVDALLRQRDARAMRPLVALALACTTSAFAFGCGGPAAVPEARPASAKAVSAPELTTVELVRKVMPNVVAVTTPDGTGSGFFLAPDVVATCFHVARGSKQIGFKAAGWTGEAVEVLAWSEDDDVAILRVYPPAARRAVKLDAGPYVVGSKVLVVSSPMGLQDSVSDGLVSAIREGASARIQFTAPISPGSSGGPVVNVKGEVVGMVAAFKAGLDGGVTIGQNLNFAVPARLISAVAALPQHVTLGEFASQTEPAEDKRWRETGEKLAKLRPMLPGLLGDRVGGQLAAALQSALDARNAERIKTLLSSLETLRGQHKALLEATDALRSLGGRGPRLAAELEAAWEDDTLSPSDETRAALKAAQAAGHAFADEVRRQLQAAAFPDNFLKFPFMASAGAVSEYCFGYQLEARAGLADIVCPIAPVMPSFATGKPGLTFLNGRLVAVQIDASSYRDAVRALASKYGQPEPAEFSKGRWVLADQPSFGPNTSFNWQLNGGRIRVGLTTGRPFIAFIRDERDQAITSSY